MKVLEIQVFLNSKKQKSGASAPLGIYAQDPIILLLPELLLPQLLLLPEQLLLPFLHLCLKFL